MIAILLGAVLPLMGATMVVLLPLDALLGRRLLWLRVNHRSDGASGPAMIAWAA